MKTFLITLFLAICTLASIAQVTKVNDSTYRYSYTEVFYIPVFHDTVEIRDTVYLPEKPPIPPPSTLPTTNRDIDIKILGDGFPVARLGTPFEAAISCACDWYIIESNSVKTIPDTVGRGNGLIRHEFSEADLWWHSFDVVVRSANDVREFKRFVSRVTPKSPKQGEQGVTTIDVKNGWYEKPLTNTIILKGKGSYLGFVNQSQGTYENPIWIQGQGVEVGSIDFNAGCSYIILEGFTTGGILIKDGTQSRALGCTVNTYLGNAKYPKMEMSHHHYYGGITISTDRQGVNIQPNVGTNTLPYWRISYITILKAGLEAIYVGWTKDTDNHAFLGDVVIDHCIVKSSGNDGLQPGSIKGLEVHDCEFYNSGGTATSGHGNSLSFNQGNSDAYIYRNKFIDGQMIYNGTVGTKGGNAFFISNEFTTKYNNKFEEWAGWDRTETVKYNPTTKSPSHVWIGNKFNHPTGRPIKFSCHYCGSNVTNVVWENNESNVPQSLTGPIVQQGMPADKFAEYLIKFDNEGYKK